MRLCLAVVSLFAALSLPAAALEAGALKFDGASRSYLVEAPKSAGARLPLVIVLHGGGGNADNAVRMTRFDALARREGFIALFPDGTARIGDLRTWNAGHCCAAAMRANVDDVGFIDALIDEMDRLYGVDPARIYVTGMSNGAMMAHRIGIDLSGRVAAIAPVVGALFGDEVTPAHPVAVLTINGALDRNVPPEGGMGADEDRRFPVKDRPYAPASAQSAFWGAANGCDTLEPAIRQGQVETQRQTGCDKGADVFAITVLDNGHAWPGGQRGSAFGDTLSTALDATAAIWAFFAAHPKQ